MITVQAELVFLGAVNNLQTLTVRTIHNLGESGIYFSGS